MTRLRLLWLLSAALATSPAQAQDEEDAALAELMQTLDQETEVATRTRMNRDFVPGMVSVLDGEELRALGVRTVWEALAQIPGVETTLDGRGNPTLTARGLYFPFNSGSIQILLNGFPLVREDIGSNSAALFLPIAHVERLEFVRGPGSVLYGDFAFQGLLNILTMQDHNLVEMGADGHGQRSGHLAAHGALGDWRWSASLASMYSDDAVLPRPRAASDRRRSGVVQVGGGGFRVLAQGEWREISRSSSVPVDPGFHDASWTLAGEYTHSFSDALDLRVHAQHLDNELFTGTLNTPQGSVDLVFEGTELRAGAELSWRGWARQEWLVGADWLHGDIDLGTFRGVPRPPQPPALLRVTGETRRMWSLFAQDQIELREGLNLTLGARYDDNADVGTRLTPRASLVWRPAEKHVFKAQYAQGHRAPTFFELYARPEQNLDFEVNATSELSYIYRLPGRVLRATLYRSRLSDMVFLVPRIAGFDNVSSAESRGVELEWSERIGTTLGVDAALTWTDAEDNRNLLLRTDSIASSPRLIGHLGLSWRPLQDTTFGLVWQQIGDRDASTLDSGGFDRVDLSMLVSDWPQPGLDLRVGIDNVLDERTTAIATSPVGATSFDYRDRISWAELRWRF